MAPLIIALCVRAIAHESKLIMATAPLEAVCKICGETSVQEFCFAKRSFDIRRCTSCGVGWTAIEDSMDIGEHLLQGLF